MTDPLAHGIVSLDPPTIRCDGCGCSPYRVVIDQRRQRTATTHPEWTPGHSLNDAMRVASKRLLRDLWREARRCHGFADEGCPTVITAYLIPLAERDDIGRILGVQAVPVDGDTIRAGALYVLRGGKVVEVKS